MRFLVSGVPLSRKRTRTWGAKIRLSPHDIRSTHGWRLQGHSKINGLLGTVSRAIHKTTKKKKESSGPGERGCAGPTRLDRAPLSSAAAPLSVQWFRGGLVIQALRLLYHSKVIKQRREKLRSLPGHTRVLKLRAPRYQTQKYHWALVPRASIEPLCLQQPPRSLPGAVCTLLPLYCSRA